MTKIMGRTGYGAAAILLLAALIGAGFSYMNKSHSRYGAAPAPSLIGIAAGPEAQYMSWNFDHLRELVNAHSARASGDEKSGTAGRQSYDAEALGGQIYEFAIGNSAEPPVLSKFERSAVLLDLLRDRGYRARMVTLIAPGRSFPRHPVVEAYNRRTQSWEMQDADYNAFFVFRGSTQRVEVRDMISQPLDNFTPCVMEGYCGWNSVSAEQVSLLSLKPYFAAALVSEEDGGQKLLLNPARIDQSALCSAAPALCHAATEHVD